MTWLNSLVITSLSFIEQFMIGCLLLVSAVVIYRATIRLFVTSPLRLLLVIMANLISAVAVLFLIIPIHVKQLENEKVILLTDGYLQSKVSKESFCHIKEKIYYLTAAARLNEDVGEKINLDTKITSNSMCEIKFVEINHISELSIFEPKLNRLDIYGDGLSNMQLQQLKPMKIQFFPSEPKSGFVDLQWSKEATLGESITFTAKLQISAQSTRFDLIHIVQLMDVNGELLDELKVKHDEVFTFNFTPKTLGKHIYRIHLLEQLAVKGEDHTILVDDPIAVNITESVFPRVLIIQSSPQYETKHFKHWLTENNGQILTLTQISKSHVMSEKVNFSDELTSLLSATNEKINTIDEVLTETLFKHFDLLIMDTKSLTSFNNDKLSMLDKAIHNGLGILILTEHSLINKISNKKLSFLNSFREQRKSNSIDLKLRENSHKKQVALNWLNHKSEQLIDANNIDLRFFSAQSLIFDQLNQPLVISNNYGKGKVALTTVTSSFQLKLNGLYNEYSQFWQLMTSELASNKQQTLWLSPSKNSIVFMGEMAKSCLLAENELIKSSKVLQLNRQNDEIKLLLDSRAKHDNQYCSVYFSNKSGWQQFLFSAVNDNKATLSKPQFIYQYAENDWLAWQQYLTHSISTERAKKSKLTSNTTFDYELLTPKNKLIVFLVLLFSSSFLWIERKLY